MKCRKKKKSIKIPNKFAFAQLEDGHTLYKRIRLR